jgi:hypothetical protein
VHLTELHVVLVDDEPDVHEISRLARRGFRVYVAALPAVTPNEDGDRYTIDGRDLLTQIAPTSSKAAVQYMLQCTVAPPDWEVFLYHRYLRTFSAQWKQAA